MLEKEINLEVVNDVVSASVEDCIFAMIDSIAAKKKEEVYDYYRDLLYLNESPIKIISILYTKFKQVFLVQCNYQLDNTELAAKTGLTFFQIKQAKGFIQFFSPDELIRNMMATQRLEVEIKTGKIDQYLGLDNLLIEILG
jgi:DNA polymerase-3 subunit delta